MSVIFQLLNENSSVDPIRAVGKLVHQKPELAWELWKYAKQNQSPLNWHSAWVLSNVFEEDPNKFQFLLDEIIAFTPKTEHVGVRRGCCKILSMFSLPLDDSTAPLLNFCFQRFLDTAESVSVKVYCMDIVEKWVQIEPDLSHEFRACIENMLPDGTPGLKNKGLKILQKLK